MTRKSKKELTILIGLLIGLSISIFSQVSKENQSAITSSKTRSNVTPGAASNEGLAVDLLSSDVPEFSDVKRNIFQFGSGAKSAAAEPSVVPVPAPQSIAPSIPAIPEVHYLGFYYEKDTGLKMASLSNSGRVYVGKIGQVLGGRYQILEIAVDHVILKILGQEVKFIRVPLGRSPPSYVEWNKEQE